MSRIFAILLVAMFLQACDSITNVMPETHTSVSLNETSLLVETAGNATVKKGKADFKMQGLGDCTVDGCESNILFKPDGGKKADFHLQFLPIEMTASQSIFMEWGNKLPSFKATNGDENFAQSLIYKVGEELYIKQKFTNPAINFVELIYYNNNIEVARINLPKTQVENGVPVDIGYQRTDKNDVDAPKCWVVSSGGTKINPEVDFARKIPCTSKSATVIENINIEFKPDVSLAGKYDERTFKQNNWMSVGTQNVPEITLKEIK